MKTYTKFSYIKKITLLSLVVLSSEVQADITGALQGTSTVTLTSLNTAVAAVQTVVDNLNTDHDTLAGTGIDGGNPAVTGGTTLTASTNNLSSLSKTLSAIEGANFATGTDSLEVISANQTVQGVVLLATNAQAVDILGANTTSTVITGHDTAYIADTNDLTIIAQALASIKGTSYSPTTDSLKIISDNQGTQGLGALATSSQAVDILGANVTSTVITGHDTAYIADTNDLTIIAQALASIKGTSYSPTTDSLKIISDNQGTQGLGALATSAQVGTLANDSGTATIAGILGNPGSVFGAAATISSILGNPTGVSLAADIIAVKAETVEILADTAVIGTAVNTGGTATIAGILGDVGANAGGALSLSLALAYLIANVQIDPITQVNTAKDLVALTTAITLGAGTPDAATTTAKNTYETNLATARTAAATATTIATQTNANTATAITNINTAITNFDSLMTAIFADDDTGGNVAITSTYTEARIKWALYQLLWSLQQLKSKQATA